MRILFSDIKEPNRNTCGFKRIMVVVFAINCLILPACSKKSPNPLSLSSKTNTSNSITTTQSLNEAESSSVQENGSGNTVATNFSQTKASLQLSTTKHSNIRTTQQTLSQVSYQNYLNGLGYRKYKLAQKGSPYYTGRWVSKSVNGSNQMVTPTSGSEMSFLVDKATEFTIQFNIVTSLSMPYFSISIDGSAPIRKKLTDSHFKISSKIHVVRIIMDGMSEGESRWLEGTGYAVKGVSCDGQLVGIQPVGPKVFFFGDSITEGVAVLSKPDNRKAYDSETNSVTNTYAWESAEQLNAVAFLAGYGDTGITRMGSFASFPDAVDYLYKDHPVDSRITPDVIVINHGCNDFRVSDGEFENTLQISLKRLHSKYPKAKVAYVIPFSQAKAKSIRWAMNSLSYGSVIETADWKPTTCSDKVHLDVNGAKKAGSLLARALKKAYPEIFCSPLKGD